MIYRFLILSDEADDFAREISIDPEASFFDLHNVILDSVNYSKDQITSFFICSEDWEKEQEITLMEMDSGSEYDNLTMKDTKIEDLASEEGQKILYIFDYIADRAFFIELKEIVLSKSLEKPFCSLSRGEAPPQIMSEEIFTTQASSTNIDESFFGDEGFNLDELDEEGYSGFENENPSSMDDANF